MHSPDFLHKDAETTLCDHYIAAGAICSLRSNSGEILQAARETFLPAPVPVSAIAFSMRLWVDDTNRMNAASPAPSWPKPYVRGMDHLIFAGFDESSSFLADLRTRRIIGRFSPAMAADRAYFKTVIFPMLLTIVSATVGIAELHCACVAKNENGLLLAGPSGAGKSTLALALSQSGFAFVSDDRTFCSAENSEVYVWGLPTRLKLRAESTRWFAELRGSNPFSSRSAEVWLEPEQLNGVKRLRRGRATSVIFLERRSTNRFSLSPITSDDLLHRLTQGMMAELPEGVANRSETLSRIGELPGWVLQYGGPPQQIARLITQHLGGS